MAKFIEVIESEDPDIRSRSEEYLTEFCVLTSKIQMFINQFTDESNYFKYTPFVVKKVNIPNQLRKDLKWLKRNYQKNFDYVIPTMKPNGKLIFNNNE